MCLGNSGYESSYSTTIVTVYIFVREAVKGDEIGFT